MKDRPQIPLLQDFVIQFSEAPSLHIGNDPVVGVFAADPSDPSDPCIPALDHTHKLQFALKIRRKNRQTGEVSEGVLQLEVPVSVGKIPTEEQILAAKKPLYGFIRLGPGVWKLSGGPVAFVDNLAGYVTVTGCPDPAPWESAPSPIVTL